MGKVENLVLNKMTPGELIDTIDIHRERMDQLLERDNYGDMEDMLHRERARTHNMVNILFNRFGLVYIRDKRKIL